MTRFKRFFFVLVLIPLLSCVSDEQAVDLKQNPLVIHPHSTSIEVSEGLFYLTESNREFTPDSIAAQAHLPDWKPALHWPLHIGSPDDHVWLRFRVENQSRRDESWILHIDWPFLDRIELYLRGSATGQWLQQNQVNEWHLPEYSIDHFPFVFELDTAGSASFDIYLRVHSPAKMLLPIKLWREDAFRSMTLQRNIWLGLFFGVLLVMCLYNAFLYIFTKDKIYAYYVLYVFSLLLYTSSMSGIGVAHIWGANAWINMHAYGLFSSISFLLAAYFIRGFLALPERGGWPLHLGNAAVIFWFLMVVLFTLSHNSWLIALEDAGAVASCFIGLLLSITLWIEGNISAKYLTIAWTAPILATFILMMGLTGVIPYNFPVQHSQHIGFVIEVILLSLALADKINRERCAKETAQKLSLNLYREANEAREREMLAQRQTLAVERAAKEELSAKVDERTNELKQTLQALEAANDELALLSQTDGLTQLANRRYFDQVFDNEFSRAVRNQHPISIVLGDIDLFKQLNDRYGHQAGDECLIKAAEAFKSPLTRANDLPARYGGEEFVAILPNTPVEGAVMVAERIRQAVEQIVHPHDGKQITFTMSLGVCGCIPSQHDKPDHLVKRADQALYLAKENGRNRIETIPFLNEKGDE